MNKIFCLLIWTCAAPVFAFGFPRLGPDEVEKLREARETFENKLGRQQVQIGQECFDVENPDEFIKNRVGIYYTGRMRLYRWRKNFTNLLKDYSWDHRVGEFYFAAREAIFWDNHSRKWALAFISKHRPIADFYNYRGKVNLEMYGAEPPWDRFRGLKISTSKLFSHESPFGLRTAQP